MKYLPSNLPTPLNMNNPESTLISQPLVPQLSLSMELDKLRRTGNLTQQQADSIDKEFDDFKKLFAKFLTVDAKDSIVWEKIEKLHQDAVS